MIEKTLRTAGDRATEVTGAPSIGAPFEDLPTLGGRDHVVGLLGGGEMRSVYLAHDLELDERVAVEVA